MLPGLDRLPAGLARSPQIATAYVVLEKLAPKGGARIRLSPTTSVNAAT